MAEVKKEVKLQDELDKQSSSCPWCNFDNKDEEKNLVHEKVKTGYFVRNTGTSWQCDSCGKNWQKSDLGKPWTMDLERGPAWARENKVRELGGRV